MFGYVPQGGGPDTFHRCVAEDIVFCSMAYTLAYLLKNFTWEMRTQYFPLKWYSFHPEPVSFLFVLKWCLTVQIFGVKATSFRPLVAATGI
jgi:hypothetical protein